MDISLSVGWTVIVVVVFIVFCHLVMKVSRLFFLNSCILKRQ